jgi:FtsP/CotA-like multicopper oxidase with cupredoxin domain|tara:strand:- start:664 stop:1764 length:1101 start_codon:yes stop_codon:yes gene_type:complete
MIYNLLKQKANLLIAIWIMAVAMPTLAVERKYYIAAEEIMWNYLPQDKNIMMGRPINDDEEIFTANTPQLIGSTYKKAVYREYTDASFQEYVQRPDEWQHLGILGPVIHAEVGDVIKVVFRNKASRPYTIHPHGVFYTKAAEGSPYADGTSGQDKKDDLVKPGETYTYVWQVPTHAGPANNDSSSVGWLYHSHVDEIADTNTGLVGAIIVTAAGKAKPDGSPNDVDTEFVNLFTVMNENESWYLQENIEQFTSADIDTDDEAFQESNLMHVINGYVYGNIPHLISQKSNRIRWYVMALGTEVDLHSPHWHGNTGVANGRRLDVINLIPAESRVVDMVAHNPGIWMYHCHVNDHLSAGMTALYQIKE